MLKTIAAALMLLTGAAQAAPDRISFLAGSYHVAPKMDFNQTNPGVFLTWENKGYDLSIGAYLNSFSRTSVAALAALPIWRVKDASFDAFAGLALYPEDGRMFLVHVGDIVPIGGLQARYKNVFVQLIPSDKKTTAAIIAFGLTFTLNP